MNARDVCRVVAQAPDVGLPADDARADGLGLVGQVFDDELGAVVADAVDDFDIGDGGGAQLWQGREVRGHGFDGVPRQVGDQGEGAHAARHDFAVEVGDLVHVQAEDVRDGGQVDDSFGAEGGEFGFDAGDVGGVADVVAHDEGGVRRRIRV